MSEWYHEDNRENEKENENVIIPPVPAGNDLTPSDETPHTAGEWHSDAAQSAPETASAETRDWRSNPYTQAGFSGTYPQEPPTPPTEPQTAWYQQENAAHVPPTPPYTPTWQVSQPPKKRKNKGVVIALSVIGSVAVLALTVLIAFSAGRAFSGAPNAGTSQTDVDTDIINDNAPSLNITDWADDDGGLSAEEIVNRNIDSTVVIKTYQMQSANSMYGYSFGTATLKQAGEASGTVMTKDGYIITNWHVVTNETTGKRFDRVDVTTHDGKTYENAEVIGADSSTDLAVIKIDAQNLKVAEFGDSSKLVIGARVVALGNAGGLQWSATQGIVSGLARDVYEDTGYSIKCLQTDAAINPGNSGGPLINNKGQVIGINSAKISATGYEGLGFSIPINEAKSIIDDLSKYSYVKGRVQLGITGYSVDSNGFQGFVINEISQDSVLRNTKAASGDLITAIDGVKIDGYGALRSELAKHKAGEKITLSLLRLNNRTGEQSTFTVTCQLKESRG